MVAIYDLSSDDLHLYGARGLLQPKSIAGVLHYTERDRVRLEVVLRGLRLGFSLDEITTMILGTLATRAARFPRAGFDSDRILDELRTLLARQGCPDVSVDDLMVLLRRQ